MEIRIQHRWCGESACARNKARRDIRRHGPTVDTRERGGGWVSRGSQLLRWKRAARRNEDDDEGISICIMMSLNGSAHASALGCGSALYSWSPNCRLALRLWPTSGSSSGGLRSCRTPYERPVALTFDDGGVSAPLIWEMLGEVAGADISSSQR